MAPATRSAATSAAAQDQRRLAAVLTRRRETSQAFFASAALATVVLITIPGVPTAERLESGSTGRVARRAPPSESARIQLHSVGYRVAE